MASDELQLIIDAIDNNTRALNNLTNVIGLKTFKGISKSTTDNNKSFGKCKKMKDICGRLL